MYYYLMPSVLSFNWVLVAAAVIPALLLMLKVYRSDRIEKESTSMLWKLVIGGVLCTLLAQVEERIGENVLYLFSDPGTVKYDFLLYFVVVGFAEETSKFLALHSATWKSPEFNCSFDGVIYAVFVSMGFAIWENISYVLSYGFSTALVRAVTAIPGHACFGVFMGVFYGLARRSVNYARSNGRVLRWLCVLVPTILHGAYDFIASSETEGAGGTFVVFIIILFAVSYFLVGRASKQDHYIR